MEPKTPGQGPVPSTHYDLPARQGKVVQPLQHADTPANSDNTQAVDLIRQKLNQIYAGEPDAKEEQREADTLTVRSKHQQYMHDLGQSGKSLAEIQTAWHAYYAALPDTEKHEVWREFYVNHRQFDPDAAKPAETPVTATTDTTPEKSKKLTGKELEDAIAKVPQAVLEQPTTAPSHSAEPEPKPTAGRKPKLASFETNDIRTVSEIKDQLLKKVSQRSGRHSKAKAHLQSLMFGIASGLIVLSVLLFSFFNERFIAPFMTPSRAISNTPIIIDPNNTAAGPEPKIIIPKINVDIPVVYDVTTIKESDVEAGLERGVVHYATTPNPGELGNGVIFGHSANNILNKGQYKFAFVLLRKLELGDLFYLQKDGKLYVYKVYDKKIVPPTEVSVLNAKEKPATFTLITCDPPGTNLNRLVVVGEQISPDPSGDGKSTAVDQNQADKPAQLPSNSQSLWDRIWSSLSN